MIVLQQHNYKGKVGEKIGYGPLHLRFYRHQQITSRIRSTFNIIFNISINSNLIQWNVFCLFVWTVGLWKFVVSTRLMLVMDRTTPVLAFRHITYLAKLVISAFDLQKKNLPWANGVDAGWGCNNASLWNYEMKCLDRSIKMFSYLSVMMSVI